MNNSRRHFLQRSAIIGSGLMFPTFFNENIYAGTFTETDPIANTQYGNVRGYLDDGINVFKGVRYGADTAARRFMPACPPQPWTDITEAKEYRAASPQSGSRGGDTSEDCLFLNVFTPALNDGKKRAVMFYIHGGAYNGGSGSSPLYDGVRLCKRGDVVVVSINHRLNAFGYLYLRRFANDTYSSSGNVGQLDIIMALQWVQNNIHFFGGDANRVLVFGQSGGGAKIATMMAMPEAKGLFHRAATMSGQQVTASGPHNATLRTQALLDAIGIKANQIDELRTMPFEKIVEGLRAKDPVLDSGGLYFGPVLDEKHLMRHPFYPDAAKQSLHVPMIIGNTHDETRAFLGRDESNYNINWQQLAEKLVPNMRVDIRPEYVIEKYRAWYPNLSPSDLLFKITTASRSWRGAIIEAEERAKANAPTYAYQLNWATPKDNGKYGAPHASDIQLVFDNINKPGASAIGPDAQKMADIMSETFIHFAKTGDPNNAMIPSWKTYTMANRETMIFDVPPRMESDPRGEERKLFEQVPYIQPGS